MRRAHGNTLTMLATGTAIVMLLAGCGSTTDGAGGPGRAGGSGTAGSVSAPSPTASGGSGATGMAGSGARQAIEASLRAAQQATAYRVVASGEDDGKPLDLDVHYGSNGAAGSVEMSGVRVSVRVVGSFVYFNAPSSFWRQTAGDAAAKRFAGAWVKTSRQSEAGKGFAEFADRNSLISAFSENLDDPDVQNLKRLGRSSVNGVPTTTYGDSEGTIDIASSGTPFPLKLVSKESGDGGTLVFSDWNRPFTVSPPPPAQTVSLPS